MHLPRGVARKLFRNPLAVAGLTGIAALVVIALIGPYVAPYPEDAGSAIHLDKRFQPPGVGHLLGTDEMGRDLLTRIIYGAGISLRTGVLVVTIASVTGVLLGATAGYAGGLADEAIMRLTDAFLAIPSLVLALAIAASLGPSLTNALLAISTVWWPWYARLVRGQTISLRELDFIQAARVSGSSPWMIITKHIVPNCVAPVIVQVSLDFGYVVLTAASLGFLGLGAQPPTPEWGLMVSSGRRFFPDWWWVSTFPGLAIFVTVLCFNLIGDGLRDALDPKLKD